MSLWARIRLADRRDAPVVHRLLRDHAEFERLPHLFNATEADVAASLFPSPAPPPFRSVTTLVLELSPIAIPQGPNEDDGDDKSNKDEEAGGLPLFRPITWRVEAAAAAEEDAEAEEFASAAHGGGRVVVAGYVLCFPNYSSFSAKAGLYMEDLFVRKPWRKLGLGRRLLLAVAAEAARLGMGRVEWCVTEWNANAIGFYERLGAEVLPQWRICRLTEEALAAYKDSGEEGGGN